MGKTNQRNIWNEFKQEMGNVNVSNQYIELTKRLFEESHSADNISELAKKVGLSLSSTSTGIDAKIAVNYIVGIHRCVENFLLQFKDFPGSPTQGKVYDPEKDSSRLEWTVRHCFASPTEDVKRLKYICEYYRLVRNHSVHSGGGENAINIAFSKIKSLDGPLLDSGMSDRLQAPNTFYEISFDDQVLFSRAASRLCGLIYRESCYDWDAVLSYHGKEIRRTFSAIWDSPKRASRIVTFVSRMYPVHNKEPLLEAIMRLN